MDRATVDELYRRLAPMVHARARRLLRSDHAARDAVHDVFLRVMRAGDAFRAQASQATWLYRITTNHCLNVLRDRARRDELWSWHGATDEPVTDGGAATRVLLRQILAQIDEELQEIAVYHLVDELNHDEIARLTGMSRRTIGNRLEQFRAEASLAAGAQESS